MEPRATTEAGMGVCNYGSLRVALKATPVLVNGKSSTRVTGTRSNRTLWTPAGSKQTQEYWLSQLPAGPRVATYQ